MKLIPFLTPFLSIIPFHAARAAQPAALATANNSFAFDLTRQIANEQPAVNVFISPFSVSIALQMTANGAAGETKLEMLRALKTDGIPAPQLNTAFNELNESLKSQTNVILDLANSIWYQIDTQLKPGFVSDNRRFFHADLAPVDFLAPRAANIINDWAAKSTRGKIKNVVQFPFPPRTRLLLANAIYFKGKWETPFDTNATADRAFHLSLNSEKQVPMMVKRGHFQYLEGADFQAVKLPYEGGRLQMIVFLPATNSTPEKVLAGFNGGDWSDSVLARFRSREGTVALPRFKLDFAIELNQPLHALGVRTAFSDSANFSAMADEPLSIGEVKQKSFVEVNEEGTEAAAVTTVTVQATAAMPFERPFSMIADRPFLFLITDSETQTILFTGILRDPAAQR